MFVVPECSPELKPVVGLKFQSLDFAFAFYDVYARTVGFYGMERPEVVQVHPPDVVKTKGHASSSASRLISKR